MFNLETTEPKISIQSEKLVINYLNEKAGTRYRYGKANTKFVTARLKDGFTIEELLKVVDQQVFNWANTERAMYLRPATLFNDEKFNQYFGQLGLKIQKDVKMPRTNDEWDKLGRELNILPRRGETYPNYKDRLLGEMRSKLDE